MYDEIKINASILYSGKYDALKASLASLPSEAKLFFEAEPYCTIQEKASLQTMKLLLDDPRFVFDDLFIGRQLYFSSGALRKLVMSHPKFLKVVRARKSFLDYFYERYGSNANRTHVGMLQRYLQVENLLQYRKKRNNFRLTFLLYPALISHIRSFKHRYYAPNGLGFLKAKSHFESELDIPYLSNLVT